MSGIDRFTRVDDKLERTNSLLASLVEAQGTVNLPENTDPTPYGTITVPDGRNYIGTVPGQTVVDFGEGRTYSKHVGDIIEHDAIDDLSRELDAAQDELRSLFVYVDAPVQLSFDGTNTQTLEAGNYYQFVDSGFTRVQIEAETTVDFTLAASTRREAFSVDGVAGYSAREANRQEGTYDGWERPNFASQNVWNDFNSANYPESLYWYVRPFGSKVLKVGNGSSLANSADVRVLAADMDNPAPVGADDPNRWYEIGAVTLAQGEQHKFVIDEPHHLLTYEFTNTTAGEDVTVGATCIGGTN